MRFVLLRTYRTKTVHSKQPDQVVCEEIARFEGGLFAKLCVMSLRADRTWRNTKFTILNQIGHGLWRDLEEFPGSPRRSIREWKSELIKDYLAEEVEEPFHFSPTGDFNPGPAPE